MPEKKKGLAAAVATVESLRGEQGCPWDKEQTHSSLRTFLLEETYELLEALDALSSSSSAENLKNFKEELGDLLLQILLHSEIARQSGHFGIEEVGQELSDKLVRRHPHVFGDKKLSSADEVVGAWEKTKKKEKPAKESVLDGVPAAMPALQRSLKVIEKVSRVGFQWPDLEGPLGKVREELGELERELEKAGGSKISRETALPDSLKKKLEAELGDLLFTIANLAYFLRLNPEDALRTMLQRFERRFRSVEMGAKAQGKELEKMTLEEMDELWNRAKSLEK
ncbi:MAG TPA: nucleoside triphosphate pyrophosphohydrolase [Bdellovibrionota bacterium]|jgi:tetrapyrrole methylase family protein/MazG family protein